MAAMSENLRETFRIDAEAELEAELFHEGRVSPCSVHNLSAGGAKVASRLAMPAGAQCTLGVRLGPSLRTGAKIPPYVSFLMEALEAIPLEDGEIEYRLRSTTAAGSSQYEAAAKLVFATQRAIIAQRTGASDASPMVVDEERRKRFRLPSVARFSKRSLRPGRRD